MSAVRSTIWRAHLAKSWYYLAPGRWARAVLTGLRKAGVEPLAFVDNKRDLWHQQVMGLPVLSAAEAVEQYGKTACFVVTIYQGSAVRAS